MREVGRNDDGVAGEHGGTIDIAVLVTEHRAIGSKDEDTLFIGVAIGSTCLLQVVALATSAHKNEGIGAVHLAFDGHRRWNARDDEAVAIFKRKIGQSIDAAAVGLDFKHDTADGLNAAESRDNLVGLIGGGTGGGGVLTGDRLGVTCCRLGGDLRLH